MIIPEMGMPTLKPQMVITICPLDNGWVVKIQTRTDTRTTFCKDAADIVNLVNGETTDLSLDVEER